MTENTLTDREEEVYIALATLGAPESTRALAETIGCGTSTVSRAINSLMEKVDRGEGTLGRLFLDDELYESLVLSFRRLGETVEEFRLLVKDWQKGKIRVGF